MRKFRAFMAKPRFTWLETLLICVLFIIFLVSMTSCASSRDGYGCHGTGKIMTRVRTQSW